MLIYSPPALILAEKRARLRMCVYTCAEMKAKLEYLRKYKIQITHISPPRVQRIIRVEHPEAVYRYVLSNIFTARKFYIFNTNWFEHY